MKYTEEKVKEMINDKSKWKRVKVAKQGYGLETLINDKYWGVRAEVARQGYGLDILVNDKDEFVREIAFRKLKKLLKQGRAKITVEIFD